MEDATGKSFSFINVDGFDDDDVICDQLLDELLFEDDFQDFRGFEETKTENAYPDAIKSISNWSGLSSTSGSNPPPALVAGGQCSRYSSMW